MSDVDFPGMFAALKTADAAFRATPGTRTLFALLKAGAAIRDAGGTAERPPERSERALCVWGDFYCCAECCACMARTVCVTIWSR